MVKQTTLKLTDGEYWMLNQHKALLKCDTWEDYLKQLLYYPRQRREYVYSKKPTGIVRAVTMRMSKETFDAVNIIRRRFFKPWREFILEAAFEDGTLQGYNAFCTNSKIIINRQVERQL